jgi:hypothetical protein
LSYTSVAASARLGRRALGEQPLAGAERHREGERMQFVDEPVRQQPAHERPAAADIDVAVDPVLE